MTSTGLLVVSNIKQIGQSLHAIEKYVKNLYIHLNIPPAKVHPLPTWGKMISQLYVDSASHSINMDLRILIGTLKCQSSMMNESSQLKPVDMLFSDGHFPDICENLRTRLNIPNATIYLSDESTSDIEEMQVFDEPQKVYNTAVLGGTFDRIHIGHKIFLSQAVLRACKRLVVGVTAPNMTKSKILSELILPVNQRISEVKQFLMEIDATLKFDVVAIDDPFGPTKSDPDMDVIIVSAETLRGGQKVNEIRAQNNLRALDIFCIDVVENGVETEWKQSDGPKETKISSSNTRINLLGTRLKAPEPRPNLPSLPYIIGLTGGLASGKSNMAQCIEKKGAHVMDCDKIAHEIYAPGQVCYHKVVEHFGREILDNDRQIDRSKLGPIVFADPKQLTILNSIVWPELLLEANRRIKKIYETSATKVFILEAAILLKAGWETECHEVWSMIISPEEAVKRTMERNNLSEEEVRKRLASQMDNSEVVSKSNVVFCSQWEPEFTQQQADKAWRMLMCELEIRPDRSML